MPVLSGTDPYFEIVTLVEDSIKQLSLATNKQCLEETRQAIEKIHCSVDTIQAHRHLFVEIDDDELVRRRKKAAQLSTALSLLSAPKEAAKKAPAHSPPDENTLLIDLGTAVHGVKENALLIQDAADESNRHTEALGHSLQRTRHRMEAASEAVHRVYGELRSSRASRLLFFVLLALLFLLLFLAF